MSKLNTVNFLDGVDKPSVKDVQDMINKGMNAVKQDSHFTDILKRDLINMNPKTGETVLTSELNKIFTDGTKLQQERCKKWIKTRLQTLIKEKSVQVAILDKDKKVKKMTIKKVNLPMLNEDSKCLMNFTAEDLGQFRVIIEEKKTEVKEFEEELRKLMDKHEKFANDLIEFIQIDLSNEQIINELK